jgi:hypothetical protein
MTRYIINSVPEAMIEIGRISSNNGIRINCEFGECVHHISHQEFFKGFPIDKDICFCPSIPEKLEERDKIGDKLFYRGGTVRQMRFYCRFYEEEMNSKW